MINPLPEPVEGGSSIRAEHENQTKSASDECSLRHATLLRERRFDEHYRFANAKTENSLQRKYHRIPAA